MHVHDQILLFIKANGPVVPTKIAKTIKSEILIASAHLSDLATQGKVKVSYLKIGGSPLYYLSGQEDQLLNFAQGNTNPKDYAVLETLKDRKVLRESDLDLLSKVALRELKDFAIPLHVRTKDSAELFWKYYLTSSEQTNELIGKILVQEETEIETREEIKEERVVREEESIIEPPVEDLKNEEIIPSTVEEPIEESIISSIPNEVFEEKVIEKPEIKEKTIFKEVEKQKVSSKKKEEKTEKTEKSLKEDKPKEDKPKEDKQETLEKKPLFKKIKETLVKSSSVEDVFLMKIEDYCKEMDIRIEQKDIIRKNKEIDLIISIPSVVGRVSFFCKAKSKNRCDEKDLSSAYMESQIKKLPLLFLYTSEFTKKSQEMLESGAFDNAVVKRLEKNGS